MQPRRAVVEDKFKNGFVPPRKRFSPADNRAARCERSSFVNSAILRSGGVFVTARCVQSKSSTVRMPSRANCAGAFSANAPKRSHGIFQRRILCFRRRHHPHDTNRLRRLQRQGARTARPRVSADSRGRAARAPNSSAFWSLPLSCWHEQAINPTSKMGKSAYSNPMETIF